MTLVVRIFGAKWYNILSMHKPHVADKLESARRIGGGPADLQFDN